MSENPSEIFGDGVLVSGVDLTWFRAAECDERPSYALTDDSTFGFGTSE